MNDWEKYICGAALGLIVGAFLMAVFLHQYSNAAPVQDAAALQACQKEFAAMHGERASCMEELHGCADALKTCDTPTDAVRNNGVVTVDSPVPPSDNCPAPVVCPKAPSASQCDSIVKSMAMDLASCRSGR